MRKVIVTLLILSAVFSLIIAPDEILMLPFDERNVTVTYSGKGFALVSCWSNLSVQCPHSLKVQNTTEFTIRINSRDVGYFPVKISVGGEETMMFVRVSNTPESVARMLSSYESSLNIIEARTGKTKESVIARSMINTAWEFYNKKYYERAAEMIPEIREAVIKAAENVPGLYREKKEEVVSLKFWFLPPLFLAFMGILAILKTKRKKRGKIINPSKGLREIKEEIDKSDFKSVVELELREG